MKYKEIREYLKTHDSDVYHVGYDFKKNLEVE